jgi:poly(A) polymerase
VNASFSSSERAAAAAPFCADQGALLLLPGFAAAVEQDPALALQALLKAAEEQLYVPHDVAQVLKACAPGVRALPAQMRGEALRALLLAPDPAAAIDLAARCEMLGALAPEVDALRRMPRGGALYKDVYRHTLKVLAATPPDLITRLAALFHDIAKPDTLVVEGGQAHFPGHDVLGAERAARRLRALKFDKETIAAVAALIRLHLRINAYDHDWTDSAVRRLKHDAGEQWQRLLDLSTADVTSARQDVVNRARRRVQELATRVRELEKPVPVAPLDGVELMERFGRGPGPWIGEVKRHLLALMEAGELDPSDRDAAWRAAEAFVAAHDRDEEQRRK